MKKGFQEGMVNLLSIAGMLYEKTDNWCVWPHGGHGSSQSGCHGVEGRKPDSGGLE